MSQHIRLGRLVWAESDRRPWNFLDYAGCLAEIRRLRGTRGVGEWLYVISNPATALLKLGISRNPEPRVRDLCYSAGAKLYPELLVRATHQLETNLHYHLRFERAFGEWFRRAEMTLRLVVDVQPLSRMDLLNRLRETVEGLR